MCHGVSSVCDGFGRPAGAVKAARGPAQASVLCRWRWRSSRSGAAGRRPVRCRSGRPRPASPAPGAAGARGWLPLRRSSVRPLSGRLTPGWAGTSHWISGQQAVASALARPRQAGRLPSSGTVRRQRNSPRVMGMAGDALGVTRLPRTQVVRQRDARRPVRQERTAAQLFAHGRLVQAEPARRRAAASGSMAMTSRYMPPAMPSTRLCVPMGMPPRAGSTPSRLETWRAPLSRSGAATTMIDDEFHGGYGSECGVRPGTAEARGGTVAAHAPVRRRR